MRSVLMFSVMASSLVFGCRTTSPEKSGLQSAQTRNMQKAVCLSSDKSKSITIERSENERPFPTFHLTQTFKGRTVLKVTDLPVTMDDSTQFMIQKVTEVDGREDIEVSAGLDFTGSKASGFYMEAANGGASPLAGIEYPNCTITKIGERPVSGGSKDCKIGSIMVEDGKSIDSSDGCNSCSCNEGSLGCTEIACPQGAVPRGSCKVGMVLVLNGKSAPSSDGCNTCTCSNSSLACTEMHCAGQ